MKINLIAPINKLSYGYVSVNILNELCKLGHQVSLFTLGELDYEPFHERLVKECVLNRASHDDKAPTLIIWHHFDLAKHKVFKGKHFGFPIFELDRFNQQEIKNIESMDGLFVTANFYKKIIDSNCKVPSFVAPLGVDSSLFKRDVVSELERLKDKTVKFLVMGKWEIRKSHYEISKAFESLLGSSGRPLNIELTVACHNLFLNSAENNKWENLFRKLDKISLKIINTRLTSHKDVLELMKLHDFGIFPSKAEGWNLELNEMMSLNKKCITTDYSAHSEYCTKENSYLIPIKETEPAYDGQWFFGQGNWAKVSKDDITPLLRQAIEDKRSGKIFGVSETVSKFTWENTAKQISDIFSGV